MREIEEKIKKIIIAVLKCNVTDAVYIFGSYGTKYYDSESSDIDIAWFTNTDIDLITRIKVGQMLEDLLEMKVDLVVVNKNSVEHLLYNIFETGECIFIGSNEFVKWFDYFYDYTYSDREFLSIYMEEKMRYV